jgi:hypothetical protein
MDAANVPLTGVKANPETVRPPSRKSIPVWMKAAVAMSGSALTTGVAALMAPGPLLFQISVVQVTPKSGGDPSGD